VAEQFGISEESQETIPVYDVYIHTELGGII
jgi:hypothetical protein